MRRVEVTWWDAHGHGARWMARSDVNDGPCVVRSVGYLVKPGKKGHVSLAQTVNPHTGAGADLFHVFHIPLGMVRKIRKL